MFIPFGFWQPLENCSTKYCPTLNVLSGTLAGTVGTTQIVNTCVDDSSAMVTLPFNFHIVGNAYRNWLLAATLTSPQEQDLQVIVGLAEEILLYLN